MYPIQDLFLESFSYELQFDMHSYLHKKIYSCKKWVLHRLTLSCRYIYVIFFEPKGHFVMNKYLYY
jgi:hypothetical protein